MAVNLITRQVTARVFLDLFDYVYFRKMFNLMATEYVAEYDLQNDTLKVKIFDRTKIAKFRAGKLQRPNTKSIANSSIQKFPLGRYNTVQISKLLNALNSHFQLRSKLGFKDVEQVQTLKMYGKTSVVATGFNKKEAQQQQATQDQ
jgi:hypothetical protein